MSKSFDLFTIPPPGMRSQNASRQWLSTALQTSASRCFRLTLLRAYARQGFALETCLSVDTYDVERAATRAVILAKAGIPVLPVVAGAHINEHAAAVARELKVWQVTDDGIIAP